MDGIGFGIYFSMFIPLIPIPLFVGLDRCIGWINLFFIVLSWGSMLIENPFGWLIALEIAVLSRSRKDTDSATSKELKLMLRRIITVLTVVAIIVTICIFSFGQFFSR